MIFIPSGKVVPIVATGTFCPAAIFGLGATGSKITCVVIGMLGGAALGSVISRYIEGTLIGFTIGKLFPNIDNKERFIKIATGVGIVASAIFPFITKQGFASAWAYPMLIALTIGAALRDSENSTLNKIFTGPKIEDEIEYSSLT